MSFKVVAKNWSAKDPVKALELVEKAIDLGAKRAPEIRAHMRRYISKEDVKAAYESLMRYLASKTQDRYPACPST